MTHAGPADDLDARRRDGAPASARLAALPLVCLGYHPWSNMWKRNQSMMAELARQRLVERLVFLNPEVSAFTPPLRILRECRTVRRYSWLQVLPRHPGQRTTVLTPAHLVPLRRRVAVLGRLDRAGLRAQVRAALGGRRPYVLLVNTVRPESQELVALLRPGARLTVFDWSDDFSKFARDPRTERHLARLTDALIDDADLVLAVNQGLAARARARGARVATVINATNMRVPQTERPLSAAARGLAQNLARPVIGYAGYINPHRIDLELVGALARRHPEWTLLFLGPTFAGIERRLRAWPNVHLHPPVPYDVLQDYLLLFDVCLIPHLANPHTAGNNPLKLYDYLTTGRPVVATRVAGIEGFEDVVAVAGGRQAFIAAVESAVAERCRARAAGAPPSAAAARRQQRARQHHWSRRAREVAALLEQALATPPGSALRAGGAARRAGDLPPPGASAPG